MQDAYEILGLDQHASLGDVKEAFHRLALENHPDQNAGDDDARDRFFAIKNAYETITKHIKNYYEILDVSDDADNEQIEIAYQTKRMEYQPKIHSKEDGAVEAFEEIERAYHILKKPVVINQNEGW